MTESNEHKPMTFTCQQLAACGAWCGPGKCPMWCGLRCCQPVFAARAAAPQAQPSISMRHSEWESLSPEAQAALEQLTGAGSREEALARAQAAQDMRGKSLLTQAQQPEHPDTRALILQCRQALDEELAGWDLDPPLDHILKARDACVRWLARSPAPAPAERTVLPGAYRVRVMDDGQQLWGPAPPEPAPISDERIEQTLEAISYLLTGSRAYDYQWQGAMHAHVRALLAEKGTPK